MRMNTLIESITEYQEWEKSFSNYISEALDISKNHILYIAPNVVLSRKESLVSFISEKIALDLTNRGILAGISGIYRIDYFSRFPSSLEKLYQKNELSFRKLQIENPEFSLKIFQGTFNSSIIFSNRVYNIQNYYNELVFSQDISLLGKLEDADVLAVVSIEDSSSSQVEYYYQLNLLNFKD